MKKKLITVALMTVFFMASSTVYAVSQKKNEPVATPSTDIQIDMKNKPANYKVMEDKQVMNQINQKARTTGKVIDVKVREKIKEAETKQQTQQKQQKENNAKPAAPAPK